MKTYRRGQDVTFWLRGAPVRAPQWPTLQVVGPDGSRSSTNVTPYGPDMYMADWRIPLSAAAGRWTVDWIVCGERVQGEAFVVVDEVYVCGIDRRDCEYHR